MSFCVDPQRLRNIVRLASCSDRIDTIISDGVQLSPRAVSCSRSSTRKPYLLSFVRPSRPVSKNDALSAQGRVFTCRQQIIQAFVLSVLVQGMYSRAIPPMSAAGQDAKGGHAHSAVSCNSSAAPLCTGLLLCMFVLNGCCICVAALSCAMVTTWLAVGNVATSAASCWEERVPLFHNRLLCWTDTIAQ
eukprot:4313262-Amphidinium_carterae.1